MKALLWFIFCLALMVGPFALPSAAGIDIGDLGRFLCLGTGGLLLIGGSFVIALLKFYMRTKANEAFVRTGRGGAQVVLDGGTYVIPVLHQIVRVPLETMRLDVDRTGGDALITADKLRADLKAEFYIRVQPNREDVLNAARSLGEKTFDLRSIEELVKDKLISTLRATAATRTLDELNAKREEFAAETKKSVEADLRHNGLTLETVTVSKLDQTDPKLLNASNVFDAQGLRRIAEITQAALVERNRIERDSEKARIEKDVATRQEVLELERKRAEAEAAQRALVAKAQAERDAEARRAQIEQEQAVAVRQAEARRVEIEQEQLNAAREVAKQQAVEQASIEAQLQITQSKRAQELVEVERVKAVETANREKEVAVALAEQRRAEAEQKRLAAEAERARQEQAVLTVEVTAAAERDGDQKLIAAKKAAEQERYKKQVDSDVIAYALQREAEGKKAAAEAEYQAKIRQAEADAEAARRRAEAETALQMVAVNVARNKVEVEAAQVGVEKQRIDVEAQALANREKYGRAAIEFELGKLRIEAGKETQVAIAKALGEFLGRANFTMFGDPESARNMVDSFLKGMGLGRTIDGFLAGTDEKTQEALGKAGNTLMSTVQAVTERIAQRSPASSAAAPTAASGKDKSGDDE